jgi:(1->4)-alpha-D-glucan 1-alpha-D-glucosylmutase
MLTTATHDHKRGEDSRARLAALTALPQPWRDLVRNAPRVEGLHDADVYFLMQTLVGAWPAVPFAEFAERIEAWCRKYLREGKLRSSWQNPDIAYEELFCAFARNLILHDAHATFRQRLEDLLGALAPIAEANTFVQAVLRCTLPGVPDLYQGTEYLDLSLVDPDNRRPVDFPARCLALTSQPRDALSLSHRKQWLVATLLRARSQLPDLWEHGTYEPVAAPAGSIAFTRRHMRQALTVFARSSGTLENEGILDLEPGGADLLTGRKWQSGPAPVGELLKNWPATVIFGEHSRLFGISPSCVEMFERSA